MTYTHGLGDAQENMNDDDDHSPECCECGHETEYDGKTTFGSLVAYNYICLDEDCGGETEVEYDFA
jgi:hypothetical protein|tara:strand:+ start:3368 stop:3565 length:198 start_codon:yes stop_codon:yes gene_type:complete